MKKKYQRLPKSLSYKDAYDPDDYTADDFPMILNDKLFCTLRQEFKNANKISLSSTPNAPPSGTLNVNSVLFTANNLFNTDFPKQFIAKICLYADSDRDGYLCFKEFVDLIYN